jgi:hypothetical protein
MQDALLPSEPMPRGVVGALQSSEELIGGELVQELPGGVSDYYLSQLPDGSGRAVFTGSAVLPAPPVAASHAVGRAWPKPAMSGLCSTRKPRANVLSYRRSLSSSATSGPGLRTTVARNG